jgi:DNA-binding CsgD family transcriptional regulator
MDEVTREAIADILHSALDRARRAASALEPDSEAARELNVAQRLIETALQAVGADAAGANPDAPSPDGDAVHSRGQSLVPWPTTPLTLREEEVLRLLVEGLRNKEIAARLGISERTATFHVGNVLSKLGADGRGEAVALAYRLGLV